MWASLVVETFGEREEVVQTFTVEEQTQEGKIPMRLVLNASSAIKWDNLNLNNQPDTRGQNMLSWRKKKFSCQVSSREDRTAKSYCILTKDAPIMTGEDMPDTKVVEKMLRTFSERFTCVVMNMLSCLLLKETANELWAETVILTTHYQLKSNTWSQRQDTSGVMD